MLAESDFTGEGIRFAEIDRRMIARGKYDLDVVGHYARPDVFRLSVDTRPKTTVAFDAPSLPVTGLEPASQPQQEEALSCSG